MDNILRRIGFQETQHETQSHPPAGPKSILPSLTGKGRATMVKLCMVKHRVFGLFFGGGGPEMHEIQ